MTENSIHLNQSAPREPSSSEEEGREELSTELNMARDNFFSRSIDLLSQENSEEENNFKLRYCLAIDEIPEYEFKKLEAARVFLGILLEKKISAFKKVGQKAESLDDGEDRFRIITSARFMFLFPYSYTLETYEIFEMVRIGEDNVGATIKNSG